MDRLAVVVHCEPGRAPETVFPTGIYKDGSPVGTELNLTPPLGEAANTSYTGCLDRKA